MKNYLLTVMGDIDSDKMCKEIALSISPLVDSPNLKFQHKNGLMMLHFGTEVNKQEIYDYVQGVLYGTVDTFTLMEINDDVSVFMPKDIHGHLFDLESMDDDVSMKLNMDSVINNEDFEEKIEDEFISTVIAELNKQIKRPSLDQILDKMIDKGYDKLTEHEKETLENYSKN